MMAGQRPVILFDPISESVQAALATRSVVVPYPLSSGHYRGIKLTNLFVMGPAGRMSIHRIERSPSSLGRGILMER